MSRSGGVSRVSRALELSVIRDHKRLAGIADQWRELMLEVPTMSPLSSYPWIAAHTEHRVAPAEQWFCAVAHYGSTLCGVLPVIMTPGPHFGGRFGTMRAPRDEHTSAIEPLIRPGYERRVLPALLGCAEAEAPTARFLELGRLPDTSTTLAAVRLGCARRPHTVTTTGVGAFLPIRGTFADYRKSLSGNFRSNLNKAGRKLAKLPGVKVEVLSGADAVPDHLSRFTVVEAAGWKGEAGTAIQCSPPLVAFYRTLVEHLWRFGLLEWHFLDADGTTIAGNLALRHGQRLTIWKLGYDETYKRCSPGSLLLERIVERAHEQGDIREIDLLTDHSWYDNWGMKRRDYCDARLYSWRAASMACGLAPDRARAALRAVPALRKLVSFARRVR